MPSSASRDDMMKINNKPEQNVNKPLQITLKQEMMNQTNKKLIEKLVKQNEQTKTKNSQIYSRKILII